MSNHNRFLRGILIATVLSVNAFVSFLLVHQLQQEKHQHEREVSRTLENLSLMLDHGIGQTASKIDWSLLELAEHLEVELRVRGRIEERLVKPILADRQAWLANPVVFRVSDASGQVLIGPGSGSKTSDAEREFFMAHKRRSDNGLLVANPLSGLLSESSAIAFSRRYNYPDGRFAGVISALLPVSHFARQLSGLEVGAHGVVVLRDADTAVIARHPPSAAASQQLGAKTYSQELAGIIASGVTTRTYRSAQTADGTPRINIYRRLSTLPFHLVTGMADEDFLADWQQSVRKATALAAIFLVFTVALAWLLWRFFSAGEKAGEQLRKLSQVVEQSPESVVITNLDAKIEYVNQAFINNTGYSRTEVIGQNPSLLNSGKTPPESFAELWSSLSQGKIWQGKMFNRRKDGSEFIEFAIITPISQPDGRITHYAAVKEDITERNRIGEELDEYRERLEEMVDHRTAELIKARQTAENASLAKSTFLANMSHEIRTPINAVLGFSHLCLMLDLPPRERDYLVKIKSASESLLNIVNDILDFSKIDAGMLTFESIAFDLDDVMHQVANLFKDAALKKSVELVIGILPGVPVGLVGDPHRLTQVLVNLMSNALKFTEAGEISLTVESVAVAADAATLRFSVRDSGLGMTPEQQARLFTPFVQADDSITRKYGGTGLGLALCQRLVSAMGGELGVDSAAGRGSCFHFSARFGLQAELSAAAAEARPARSNLVGKKVLVVDNNAAMRTLLSHQAKTFGCLVTALDSGLAAIARVQSGEIFDIILMDWHMPDMEGPATAQFLRRAGNSTPIILISGDEPERARSLEGADGIQGFLVKPVSSATLADTMAQLLEGTALTPRASGQPISAPAFAGARILLVEDNDFNRQVSRELVEMTGATVVTVNDGAEAVAAVATDRYDLVLMDIQMPVMDGYSATRIIRQSLPDLPILALTANAMSEEKARVLAAGMNDIVTTPILPAILYAKLGQWLPGGGRGQPAAPIARAETRAADSRPPIFDQAAALARVNGDSQTLERFLRLFRERNSTLVEQIAAALEQQDLLTAQRLAHSLKGGAGTVGMIELQDAAKQLEATLTAAPPGTDNPGSKDFAALQAAWTRTLETLAGLLDTPATPLQGEP